MPIFRVERTQDYVVMSNYHLRDKNLSLKAKGLLSQILSLPDGWDYTQIGLARINKEGVDAIRTAIRELEKEKYIVRRKIRNKFGQMSDIEYRVYERPIEEKQTDETLENPMSENPTSVTPMLDTATQLNIDIINTDLLNIESIDRDESENPKKLENTENPKNLENTENLFWVEDTFVRTYGRKPDKNFCKYVADLLAEGISIGTIRDIIIQSGKNNPRVPEAYILTAIRKEQERQQQETQTEELADWEKEWLADVKRRKAAQNRA